MINESDILPFSTSELPDGPWLVFSPHPDDETFGMGGALLLARQKGIEVSLVTVTNGCLGGAETKAQSLVQIRKDELQEAAQLLGIKNQYFLDLDDRAVLVSDTVIETVQNIIETRQPASIFFPSILEPHPDHRATAHLVAGSVTDKMNDIDFYGYDISVQNPINTLIDISEVHAQKIQVMSVYQSQTGQNNYIDVINSLNKSRTYTLDNNVDFAEGFFHYKDFLDLSLSDQVYKQFEPFWSSQRNKMLATVSIIVRTYNRPKLLIEALKSLTQQTYSKLEVIVVNDGGTDVASIVDDFRSQFFKIAYYPLLKNAGRSDAANEGLKEVAGDYVLFLDDDDIVLPEHISVLVKSLSDNPQYKVAYTGTKVEKPEGDFIMSDPFDIALLRFGNFLPIHSVLFARELLAYVSFDNTLELYEDWDFWLQMAQHTQFLHIKDHATAIYRSLGDSGVGVLTSSSKQNQAKLKVLSKWADSWTAGEIQDTFNALEIKNKNALREHQAVIQENASRMAHQVAEIKVLKEANEKLNQINDTMNEANNALNQAIMERDKNFQAIQIENKALHDELERIYNSKSWKLFGPIRFLRRKLS